MGDVRWEATNRLIDLLRADPALTGVQIELGWPGDDLRPECVWVGDLDGDLGIPVMTGGSKRYDDMFTIPLEVRVANRRNLADTLRRTREIASTVVATLAADTAATTLGELDEIVSATVSADRSTCASTREGHLGFAEVVVSIHARLTF